MGICNALMHLAMPSQGGQYNLEFGSGFFIFHPWTGFILPVFSLECALVLILLLSAEPRCMDPR